MTEVARQVSIGPLALRIRLDRLDRLDEGGELVIDYKTGRFSPAGWKRSRLPESQLPLYAVTGRSRGVAVIAIRPPSAQLSGVGDNALGILGIKSAASFFREDHLDWPDALQRWQSQLEKLASEFAAGDFRVDPADRQWATGQFAGLTRIHELLPPADEADLANGADE
jgi:RecB family exonuclease